MSKYDEEKVLFVIYKVMSPQTNTLLKPNKL